MVDIASVRTLLRLNGLSPESPKEEIEKALRTAGYTDDDLEVVFRELSGTPPAVPAAPIAAAPVAHPPVAPSAEQAVPAASAPLWEKIASWTGLGAYLALGSVFCVSAVTSMLMVIKGYQGGPHGAGSQFIAQFLMQIFLPAVGVSVVVMLIAFFVARATNTSRTLGGWLLSLLSWYTLIWFGILEALLYGVKWYANNAVEDWASFAFSLMIGFSLAFIRTAFCIVAVLALIVGLVSFLKRPRVRSSWTARVVSVLVMACALLAATYYSGVMKYPARALNTLELCSLVSRFDRASCVFSIWKPEPAPLPLPQIPAAP